MHLKIAKFLVNSAAIFFKSVKKVLKGLNAIIDITVRIQPANANINMREFMRSAYKALVTGLILFNASQPATANDPLTDFFDTLFNSQKSHEARKPARESGEDGGGVFFGPAAEKRLEAAIKKYQKIVEKGGWSHIAAGPPLEAGYEDERIPALRKRLTITGDLPPGTQSVSKKYEPDLVAAVIRFQTRHGLTNEGLLGRQTITALNVKAETRLNQLKLNLKRSQAQSQHAIKARAIIVNIPSYELQAIENGQVRFFSRVVVGRRDRSTPTLDAEVKAINLLPTWRVPRSITIKDMIPKLLEKPDYFAKENFRIIKVSDGQEISPDAIKWSSFDSQQIRFEQKPGANNALGLIRLDMPNKHIVYLHDSPLKRLYKQSKRSYSSGCVRVERIAELAIWLLNDPRNRGAETLASIIKSGEPSTITLEKPVPVHFVYNTAWAEPDGTVNFREDIYGLDNASKLAEEYEKHQIPLQPLSP